MSSRDLVCAVPGCNRPASYGRGGAPVPLCYDHGQAFGASSAKRAMVRIASAWALSQGAASELERVRLAELERVAAGSPAARGVRLEIVGREVNVREIPGK